MNKNLIWQTVLNNLELIVPKAEFSAFFKNTKISFDQNNSDKVFFVTPSVFMKEWIKKKYQDLLFKEIKKYYPDIKDLEFTTNSNDVKVKQKQYEETPKKEDFKNTSFKEIKNINQRKENKNSFKINNNKLNRVNFNISSVDNGGSKPPTLNSKYTFSDYVVGSNSELAYAAAQAVIKNPGMVYNPLYIYGSVGLGKTHLLQATGNELYNVHHINVMYLPSEIFLSEIVSSIKNGTIENLKNKYRKVDVLILDDIQIISGKEKFQEIFFDTFNALYSKGKQIILSSDCLPSDIPALEDRLRSRFHGGMIADISTPNLETRMAILRVKSEKQNFNLPEETIHFIAENMASNIRQLEGSLNRLITQCQLSQQEPTLVYAKEILTVVAKESTALYKKVTPKDMLRIVAEYFDITIEDLKRKTRRQEIVIPRQIVMYLLRERSHLPFPTIGRVLGGRDHSTVIHAVNKIGKQRELDSNLEKDINTIIQHLERKL